MSQNKGQKPPAGEIRQSQILSSFGPGSMVDLPETSILMGGLNHWNYGKTEIPRIYEPRLEQYLQQKFGQPNISLREPPASVSDPIGPRTGIQSFMFPGWFVAQVDEEFLAPSGKRYRTRPLLPWKKLVGGKYLDQDRKKRSVVPVRFVQACVYGHISDIDWRYFVHGGSSCVGDLWLDEGGTGNDFADIFVRCAACSKRRPLSDATLPNSKALGLCQGHRPWLGPQAREDCGLDEDNRRVYNKLLVRSASNAYFAQTSTVISLPSRDAALKEAVNLVYEDFLQYAEDADDIARERKKQRVSEALREFSNDQIWAEVMQRKSGARPESKKIKQVEIETLLSQPDEIGEDLPDQDFYARNRTLDGLPDSLQASVERIVLVHRLREVRAQVSFTRFEAPFSDIDGELQLDVAPAALGLETDWFPAIETKGEGIFIAFKPEAIATWLRRDAVQKRGDALKRGFDQWLQRREIKPDTSSNAAQEQPFQFPGLPYIMLHSLSHLLITSISLDCGYSASAIRERVYAGASGYGILLYTGSSGSEGTLGGLIQVGRKIEQHLVQAIDSGRLCSNDPVCAQHKPYEPFEERFRHGAACHGCLLISETSCEQGNEFLDRALVVETLENEGAAFFPFSL